MPKGYRCIFVAFVGWLSLANAPSPRTEDKQPQAQANQNQAAKPILTPINAIEPVESSKLYRPCYDGEEVRNSDLCAQWYAADAAKRAATAAWVFGYVGTIIGLLTLAAAGAAAWYARKAAVHTQESVVEGKRAADAASAATKAMIDANVLAAESVKAANNQVCIAEAAARPFLWFKVIENYSEFQEFGNKVGLSRLHPSLDITNIGRGDCILNVVDFTIDDIDDIPAQLTDVACRERKPNSDILRVGDSSVYQQRLFSFDLKMLFWVMRDAKLMIRVVATFDQIGGDRYEQRSTFRYLPASQAHAPNVPGFIKWEGADGNYIRRIERK